MTGRELYTGRRFGELFRWNHPAPPDHQQAPADPDNTDVLVGVQTWQRTGQPIHPRIAMVIASWYHRPNDPAVTAFSHTGTVLDGLVTELVADRAWEAEQAEQEALDALLAYVRAIPTAPQSPPSPPDRLY